MYNDLASVYDKLMEDMPYKEWAEFIDHILKAKKRRISNIIDLGSGTGSISVLLSDMGYSVTNLDFSNEMLEKAKGKYEEKGLEGHFIELDIRDIEFTDEFDCGISTFDTMNYFIDEEELLDIFKRVYQSLKDEGVFIFDMNTKYKFEKILGEEIYTYNTEDIVYIWENEYNKETEIMEIDLSFFIKTDEDSYKRFNESHVQRYYSIKQIVKLLKEAGFKDVEVNQDLEFKKPEKKGIRNFFTAMKG